MEKRAWAALAILVLAAAVWGSCGGEEKGTGQQGESTATAAPSPVTTVPAGGPTAAAPTVGPSPTAPFSAAPTVPAGEPTPTVEAANVIAVDADPATPAVDDRTTQPLGVPFDVSINVTTAGTAYDGYQFSLRWDTAVLSFVSGTHLSQQAGFSTCTPLFEQLDPSHVAFFCVGAASNYVGQHDRLTFQCVGSGTTTLHLETASENPDIATVTVVTGGGIPTGAVDAAVTCE